MRSTERVVRKRDLWSWPSVFPGASGAVRAHRLMLVKYDVSKTRPAAASVHIGTKAKDLARSTLQVIEAVAK